MLKNYDAATKYNHHDRITFNAAAYFKHNIFVVLFRVLYHFVKNGENFSVRPSHSIISVTIKVIDMKGLDDRYFYDDTFECLLVNILNPLPCCRNVRKAL